MSTRTLPIFRTRDAAGESRAATTAAIAAGAELRRAMAVGKVDKEKRTIELAFSSDIELKRWGDIEVLSHEKDAVDMSRLQDGAACLFNHDFDQQIGVIESARIDSDGKGRAVVRFGNSAFAEEKWRDVQDGILRHVSVGYKVIAVKLTETREDGTDVYVVTRWEPYEISFVTVPADPTVGVGRTLKSPAPAPAQVATTQKPTTIMNRERIIAALKKRGIAYNETDTDERLIELLEAPAPAAAAAAEVTVTRSAPDTKAGDAEFNRVRSIRELGKKYDLSDLADEHILERKSEAEFKQVCLDKLAERTATLKQSGKIGLSEKEAQRFSFTRLARYLLDPANNAFRKDAEHEIEVCQAAAATAHRSVKGLLIPVDVLRAPMDPELAKRAEIISIKTGSGYTGTGSSLVQTTLLASSFVDLLRPRTFLMRRASVLGGLVGNFDVPKQTTGAAGGWIGEDDPAAQQDIDFGLIPMSPKTCAGFASVTRRMLMQPSLDVEALVRVDLARGLAQTIDRAGLYGTGTSSQPKGLKLQDGINAVDFAGVNPTFAELVQMETEIGSDNAEVDFMAYVINAVTRGYAKSTAKFGSGTETTIWEAGGTINGYGTEVTNQVASGDIFFGNWADFWMAMWGGLELNVDSTTHMKRGRIELVAMQDVDFAIRRPESFTYGKQLTP